MKSFLFLLIGLIIWTQVVSAQAPAGEKYWIFLHDKGQQALAKAADVVQEAESRLSPRALKRRAKVLPPEKRIDASDFAVYRPYLDRLESLGVKPIVISRWLNAVSALLTDTQRQRVAALAVVDSVVRVRRMGSPPEPDSKPRSSLQSVQSPTAHAFDYGASLTQNAQLQIPTLHDAGIFGEGVVIGMLDSGFKYDVNPAFQSLQVLAEHDFVFNDSNTADETGDVPGQQNHGTETLSVIGGYAPGELIGPAFKAKFFLSKTEDLRSETPAEEDNWLAGIEWMEAEGIDVASSSLGYAEFDNPADNHTYADLDGKTTVITRAAQMATEKGVVVVNSAGNKGTTNWHYVDVPADGVDVLAAGAVFSDGRRVSFSSLGPTFDGRIKPDVMAQGASVYVGLPTGKNAFDVASGTSFSCPLVAGVAALVLSAHPELTPKQVNEALRMTASHASAPDNLMGYGIANARAAATYWGPAFSNQFSVTYPQANTIQISIRVLADPEVDANATQLYWRADSLEAFQAVQMAAVDSTLFQSPVLAIQESDNIELYFSVEVPGKGVYTNPRSAPQSFFRLDGNLATPSPGTTVPEDFDLSQNYPNPLPLGTAQTTRFVLGFSAPAVARLSVFNLLGQEVARPIDDLYWSSDKLTISWQGRSFAGTNLPVGIYFYRATFRQSDGKKVIKEKKLVIIR